MQFTPSGAYFARAKVKGKIYRRSLETDVFTTAKLKLLSDMLKTFKKPKGAFGHRTRRDQCLIRNEGAPDRVFCNQLVTFLKRRPER